MPCHQLLQGWLKPVVSDIDNGIHGSIFELDQSEFLAQYDILTSANLFFGLDIRH
jgi:hypothetical protein